MTASSAKRVGYTLIVLFVCNILYFYFPFPPIVWRTIIISIDVYVIFKSLNIGFSYTERSILLFVALVSIYFLIGYANYDFSFTNIGNMYVGLLSFPTFSSLARRDAFDNKFFRNVILILTAACIPYYLHARELAFLKYEELGYEVESVTVNGSVVFAMLTPAILLIKQQKYALITVGICIFFLLAGSKRGNILAAIIPILLYCWNSFQQNKKSIWKVLLMLIILVASSFWIFDLIQNNEYLQTRFDQTLKGNSSNRDVIYNVMWNLWAYKSDALQLILGYGYNGTILYSGIGYFAHNDWLEILVDFGLVGLICYLNIFLGLFKLIIQNQNPSYKNTILALLSVWFVKATFSMGFNEETMFILSLPFAYVVGNIYLQKNYIRHKL